MEIFQGRYLSWEPGKASLRWRCTGPCNEIGLLALEELEKFVSAALVGTRSACPHSV